MKLNEILTSLCCYVTRVKQGAQLSQRGRAMLHVVENFAKLTLVYVTDANNSL